MSRELILLIDDNVQNMRLARFLLTAEGYVVQTAADAEEALQVLQSFTPSLILMDVQLPNMDGLELTRRLKADPARRGITIVALTAYAMLGDEEKALTAGCDGYISKPIDVDAFPGLIAGYLDRGPVETT